MTLAEGDYRAVEDQVVATLLADTGPGGLCETGSPAVNAVRAGDLEIARRLGQDDYPAVLARVLLKSESPAHPAYAVIKSFTVRATALARGLDREAAENSARKIAARLETVLRDQTASDRQFQGLPDLIEGGEGVLVSLLRETRFPETEAKSDHVTAAAEVRFELQVPCVFRYE